MKAEQTNQTFSEDLADEALFNSWLQNFLLIIFLLLSAGCLYKETEKGALIIDPWRTGRLSTPDSTEAKEGDYFILLALRKEKVKASRAEWSLQQLQDATP